MDLGPVFRALVYQKGRFWLIALEVALTLAIVVNCVNLAREQRGRYLAPSGIAEDEIVIAHTRPFAPEYKDKAFLEAVRQQDLERLRALPAVRAAAAISNIPLSGGGSSTGRKPQGSEIDSLPAPYFVVSDGALEALGVELAAGRDFTAGDFPPLDAPDSDEGPVLVTRAMADGLFPDGDALGKTIVSGGDSPKSNVIVGIVERMHNAWPDWSEYRDWVMLVPGRPGSDRRVSYLVRAEAGSVDEVYAAVEPLLVELEPGRIVELETLREVKDQTYSSALALIKLLSAVILLLVFVTALGIVGLTSFSVTQRRRQIGTRRALGATRGDILRYFLLENWLITALGLAVGVALAYGLNYALAEYANAPKMDWQLLAAGALLLWASGLLAALLPALRAARVAPVVATRTVAVLLALLAAGSAWAAPAEPAAAAAEPETAPYTATERFAARTETLRLELAVPEGVETVRLTLETRVSDGVVRWRLEDPQGRQTLRGEVRGGRGTGDTGPLEARPGVWRFELDFEAATGSYRVDWDAS
ncbi:MAG TPA: FtsX-like permease family protein [Thermoanaerobaculia bacterium]|nr:FtsX-like permease family protein [Thermoanaerobaculia bacterium]